MAASAAAAAAAGSVKVVVTGGKGFLGRYLCQHLLRRRRVHGRPLDTIAILDAGADTHVGCGEQCDCVCVCLCVGDASDASDARPDARLTKQRSPSPSNRRRRADTDVQVWQPDRQDSSAEKGGVQLQHFRGDITDKALVAEALKPRVPGQQICLVHLASIMSGQGEANFDKCLSVNLDGTRNLLEASRALLQQGQSGGAPVRFVFPSSFAAFGPALEVDDDTRLAPQSTYGMTKAMAEMLVNDFTRKGWVDGRTGRLPTVIVRPGSANGAATGCFSAVVRELLMGHDYTVPVAPRQRHPVISTRRTIKGLLALADLPSDALGHDRCVRACVRACAVARLSSRLN